MAFRVYRDAETGVIHIVYTGELTAEDSRQATNQALALAAGRAQLFLADLLDAEPSLSILDIFHTPGDWKLAGSNRASRLAVVVQKGGKAWKDAAFFETTSRNQGWQVTLFSSREDAMRWLTAAPTPQEAG